MGKLAGTANPLHACTDSARGREPTPEEGINAPTALARVARHRMHAQRAGRMSISSPQTRAVTGVLATAIGYELIYEVVQQGRPIESSYRQVRDRISITPCRFARSVGLRATSLGRP